MKFKAFRTIIEFSADKIEREFSWVHCKEINYSPLNVGNESYHVNVKFTLDLPKEFLESYKYKDIQPWIGYDIDIGYYSDDHIKKTVVYYFINMTTLLKNLEEKLKTWQNAKSMVI